MKRFLTILSFLFASLLGAAQIGAGATTTNQPYSFSPLSLSPDLWIDGVHGQYTSTIDNNGTRQPGNIIDAANAETGQPLTMTSGIGPKYNGSAWYYGILAQTTVNTPASSFNFLHNDTDYTFIYTYFQTPAATGDFRVLFSTNGFSGTARGVRLLYNNTGGTNTLFFGTANGTTEFISITCASAITQNAINQVTVTKVGDVVTVKVNGVQVGTQTYTGSGWSTSDAASQMILFNTSSATGRGYLLDFVAIDRSLTVAETALMNARTFSVAACTDINVYVTGGDSTDEGQALNSQIAPDLVGAIAGAYAERFNGNIPNSTSRIGKLQLGENQKIATQTISTQHGFEMRFGKSMGDSTDLFIIKYGVSGTTMIDSWNTSASLNYTRLINNFLPEALLDLVHSKRRNPVFRGSIWAIGTNDAINAGSGLAWTRSGATITVTQAAHGMTNGQRIAAFNSSDATTIPTAIYVVTVVNASTYTFTGVNTGAASGTLDHSSGTVFKSLFYTFHNGWVNYLNDVIKNQVTGGTGYSTAQLRIFILRIKPGWVFYKAASYNLVRTAHDEIPFNYLIDNASMVGRVKTGGYVDCDDLATSDGVHYTAAAEDIRGQRTFTICIPYINE